MIANRTIARRKSKSPARRTRASSNRRSKGTVRYAVVGLGYITQAAVLPAFKNAKHNSQLAALVSGTPEKLKKLGKKYCVKNLYSYDEYDDLLRSGEIDAVFIALPNHMHADFTIRAANAGIHVLCEKPMAVTVDECTQMIEAARSNNVKLMIAYRLHFEESNLTAVEMVQSGKLGLPRFFNSTFSFNIKDQDNIRVQAEKGGGTLYDIGIYCINAARYLFQDEPTEVCAFSTSRKGDERFDEVDEMSACIMRFPQNRLASFVSSFGSSDISTYQIVGEKGEICAENAYDYALDITHHITIKGKTKSKKFKKRDQFAPELLYFSECILNDADPEPSGQEGLIDVRIIEALYESARQGEPVRIEDFAKFKRPSMEQEIQRPAVREPEMVKAESPSEE